MKKSILFILFIVFSLPFLTAQNDQRKLNPVGTWKFEAPSAQEGYTSGTIIVSLTEQKYNTTISFTGNEYKLTGDKVKFENDSLFITVNVEGEDVKVILKVENETRMLGKAVSSQGEVPLTLTKSIDENQK